MLQFILNLVSGCPHRRTTFPLTPKRSGGAPVSRYETYVACLDCGKELSYDWDEMRIGAPMLPRGRTAEAQPSFR
jgi:hypothetical protein